MIVSGLIRLGVALLVATGMASSAFAASDAEFPKGWESWPVITEGAIPDNKSPVPAGLPPILLETVKTYNWVDGGKGSAYKVRINPAAMDAYKKRDGYPNGSTGVLELTGPKVIIVTEHLLNKPFYGAFDYEGKDLAGAHPSLEPKVCATCHSGFQDACVVGVCSKPKP